MATKAKIALVNSFLALLESDEYDKVTVTNLVEKCGVSRQTFYYHFDDIEKMIEWSFKNEIDKIADSISAENNEKISEMFADFLNKYNNLLKKSSETANFITINNFLFNNFNSFLSKYIAKKHNRPVKSSDEADFFVKHCAGAFCEFVIQEMQQDEPHYDELMKKLLKTLKSV